MRAPRLFLHLQTSEEIRMNDGNNEGSATADAREGDKPLPSDRSETIVTAMGELAKWALERATEADALATLDATWTELNRPNKLTSFLQKSTRVIDEWNELELPIFDPLSRETREKTDPLVVMPRDLEALTSYRRLTAVLEAHRNNESLSKEEKLRQKQEAVGPTPSSTEEFRSDTLEPDPLTGAHGNKKAQTAAREMIEALYPVGDLQLLDLDFWFMEQHEKFIKHHHRRLASDGTDGEAPDRGEETSDIYERYRRLWAGRIRPQDFRHVVKESPEFFTQVLIAISGLRKHSSEALLESFLACVLGAESDVVRAVVDAWKGANETSRTGQPTGEIEPD